MQLGIDGPGAFQGGTTRKKIRNKPVVAVYIRGANEGVGAGFPSGGQRRSSRTAGGRTSRSYRELWLRPGAAEVRDNYTVSLTPRRKAAAVWRFS
mgnify:CR=1 FL=1